MAWSRGSPAEHKLLPPQPARCGAASGVATKTQEHAGESESATQTQAAHLGPAGSVATHTTDAKPEGTVHTHAAHLGQTGSTVPSRAGVFFYGSAPSLRELVVKNGFRICYGCQTEGRRISQTTAFSIKSYAKPASI